MTKEQVNSLIVVIRAYYPTKKIFDNEVEVAIWWDELKDFDNDLTFQMVRKMCREKEVFDISLPEIIREYKTAKREKEIEEAENRKRQLEEAEKRRYDALPEKEKKIIELKKELNIKRIMSEAHKMFYGSDAIEKDRQEIAELEKQLLEVEND